MTLAELWPDYMQVLRDRAPVTAASIRLPCAPADLLEAERTTGPWNDELRDFYRLQGGQEPTYAGEIDPGEPLPELRLFALDEAVALHTWWLQNPHSTKAQGSNWLTEVRAQDAGESSGLFLPAYIPIAEGLAGSFAYIDTRKGPRSGCVRFFAAESADDGDPWYESIFDFVRQVKESVENGSPIGDLVPSVSDGTLLWEYPDD